MRSSFIQPFLVPRPNDQVDTFIDPALSLAVGGLESDKGSGSFWELGMKPKRYHPYWNSISHIGPSENVFSSGKSLYVLDNDSHIIASASIEPHILVDVVGSRRNSRFFLSKSKSGQLFSHEWVGGYNEGISIVPIPSITENRKYRLAVADDNPQYCISDEESVSLYDYETGEGILRTKCDSVGPIAFAEQSTIVYKAGRSCIDMIDLREGCSVGTMIPHPAQISLTSYSGLYKYSAIAVNPVNERQIAVFSHHHHVVQIFDSRKVLGGAYCVHEWAIPGRELRLNIERTQNPIVRYLEYSNDGQKLLIQKPLSTKSYIVTISEGVTSHLQEIPTVVPINDQIQKFNSQIEAQSKSRKQSINSANLEGGNGEISAIADDVESSNSTEDSSSSDENSSDDDSSDDDSSSRNSPSKRRLETRTRGIVYRAKRIREYSMEYSIGASFRQDGCIVSIGSKGNVYAISPNGTPTSSSCRSSSRSSFSTPNRLHTDLVMSAPCTVYRLNRTFTQNISRKFLCETPFWKQYREKISMGVEPVVKRLEFQIPMSDVENLLAKIAKIYSSRWFPRMIREPLSNREKFFILCYTKIVSHIPPCNFHKGVEKASVGSYIWNACVGECGYRIPSYKPLDPVGTSYTTSVREIQKAHAEIYGKGFLQSYTIAHFLNRLVYTDRKETRKKFPYIHITFYRGDGVDEGFMQSGKLKGFEASTAAVIITVMKSRFGFTMHPPPAPAVNDDPEPVTPSSAMLIAKDVSSDSDSSSSGGLLGPPSSKKIRTPPIPFFERSMIERKATLVVKELVSVKDTLSHRLITMDMIQQLRERWPVPEVNLKKERISTPEKREKERLRSAARRAAKRAARDQLEAPSLVLEDEIDDNPPSLTQPTTESPNSSDSQNLTTDVPLSRLLRGGPTRSPG